MLTNTVGLFYLEVTIIHSTLRRGVGARGNIEVGGFSKIKIVFFLSTVKLVNSVKFIEVEGKGMYYS